MKIKGKMTGRGDKWARRTHSRHREVIFREHPFSSTEEGPASDSRATQKLQVHMGGGHLWAVLRLLVMSQKEATLHG